MSLCTINPADTNVARESFMHSTFLTRGCLRLQLEEQFFERSTFGTALHCIRLYCMVLNPYTAERRDVSENTPPEAQEISQGRGFCTPRPERLPEGNLEGRGGCIFRYIPTRGSVRTFFHHYQGTIDFVAWQQMALASERLINSTYKHWSWLNQLLCCLAHLSH